MEVTLSNDSLVKSTPIATKSAVRSHSNKQEKFEFLKGCWFIIKKLFSLN